MSRFEIVRFIVIALMATMACSYLALIVAIFLAPGQFSLQVALAVPFYLAVVSAVMVIIAMNFGIENRHRPRRFRRKVALGTLALNVGVLVALMTVTLTLSEPALMVAVGFFLMQISGLLLLIKYFWQYRPKRVDGMPSGQKKRAAGIQRHA